MKSTLTYILLFFTFVSYSQNSGKIEYNTFFSYARSIEYESFLFFDNENSLFSYKVKGDEIYESTENYTDYIIIDTTTSTILLNKTKNILFENHFKEKIHYYSYEKQPKIKWELLSNTKVFKNITCSLAKTNFRGRVFYAWYAPSIAVSYGPWKLQGLPGLIIEAYDETKEVIFQFNKIQIPYRYDFNTIKDEINDSYKISLLEHVENRKYFSADLEKRIKTKFSRNINAKIEIKRTGIELNFDDIIDNEN